MSRSLEDTLLCLDIGNTTCKLALFKNRKISREQSIATSEFIVNPHSLLEGFGELTRLAYCSVVPEAEKSLLNAISYEENPPFALTASSQCVLPINYPEPQEIGADRIANAIAVHRNEKLPAVVIDLGTATTFDVITSKGGYEGGVIVPGPQGMLDFLETKTALLPNIRLSKVKSWPKAIGKNTRDAMLSGLAYGYPHMIRGILDAIENELTGSSGEVVNLFLTGGRADAFPLNGARIISSLTLEGLALAYWHQQF